MDGGLSHHRMVSGQLLDGHRFRRRSPKGPPRSYTLYPYRRILSCATTMTDTSLARPGALGQRLHRYNVG